MQPVILTLHRVSARWRRTGESGFLGFLDIPEVRLRRQLGELQDAGYRFIDPEELLRRRHFDQDELLLTVDDAYHGTVNRLVQLRQEFDAIPLVFVTGHTWTREPFWWDRLEAAVRTGRMNQAEARSAFRKGPTSVQQLPAPRDQDLLPATPEMVLRSDSAFRLGWHGARHREIGDLEQDDWVREFTPPDVLTSHPTFLPVYAYPFGPVGPIPEGAVQVLRRHFRRACTFLKPPPVPWDPYRVPRVYVSPHFPPADLLERVQRHTARLLAV